MSFESTSLSERKTDEREVDINDLNKSFRTLSKPIRSFYEVNLYKLDFFQRSEEKRLKASNRFYLHIVLVQ